MRRLSCGVRYSILTSLLLMCSTVVGAQTSTSAPSISQNNTVAPKLQQPASTSGTDNAKPAAPAAPAASTAQPVASAPADNPPPTAPAIHETITSSPEPSISQAALLKGLPTSPAFAKGQTAEAAARVLDKNIKGLEAAGKTVDAKALRPQMEVLANEAVKQYQLVVGSHMYGHTPLGAEATLLIARIYDGLLLKKDLALQEYKNLKNNFGSVDYPDKEQANKELDTVYREVDKQNQTTFPNDIAYKAMDFLVALTGRTANSYWLAIIMFSLIVKLLTWPLSNKQYKSIKESQKLQPYIKELQTKYKNDKEAQGRKMMELYKEHGINPMAGCGVLLIQIPIMIGLYQMIRVYEYQFSHGTFFWINQHLGTMFPGIVASSLAVPDIPITLLYALSMWVQQRMTVSPDPQQAEQQRMMSIYTPIISTYMFWIYKLPSAFLLYYLLFNVLSMAQQWWYMKTTDQDDDVISGASPVLSDGDRSVSVSSISRNGKTSSGSASDNNTNRGKSGAKPAAKGAISPKVHPKKKRR